VTGVNDGMLRHKVGDAVVAVRRSGAPAACRPSGHVWGQAAFWKCNLSSAGTDGMPCQLDLLGSLILKLLNIS